MDADWLEAVHPDDQPRVIENWTVARRDHTELDSTYRVRAADGSWRYVRARGVPLLEDGQLREWIGVIDDITEQVQAEEALRRAALEDPLTGLPNRALFLERVAGALAAPRRTGRWRSCTSTSTASRPSTTRSATRAATSSCARWPTACAAACGPSDVVSRLAGDEFAVLCDGLHSEDEGWEIAQRLAASLAAPRRRRRQLGQRLGGRGVRRPGRARSRGAAARRRRRDVRGQGRRRRVGRGLRPRAARAAGPAPEHRARAPRTAWRPARGSTCTSSPRSSFNPAWASVAEALLRWRARDGTTLPAAEVVAVAEQAGLIVRDRRRGPAARLRARRGVERRRRRARRRLGQRLGRAARPARRAPRPGHLGARDLRAAPDLLWLEITESMLIASRERTEALLGRCASSACMSRSTTSASATPRCRTCTGCRSTP